MPAPADWQLPPGVSRAVWDYAHDSTIARDYDANLAGTPLLESDWRFAQRHLHPPGRVLDLGCGTGRIAVPLARGGHTVVGLDLSEPMLAVARRKAGGGIWAVGNIADLSAFRDGCFDAAVCLFSTLGMVSGDDARRRAVAEAARVLRPGGVYLLHVHLIGHHLTTRAGRRLWLRDRLRRLRRCRDAGDFPMPAGPGSPGWTMHLFTRREVRRLLAGAGLVVDEMLEVNVKGEVMRWPSSAWAYGLLVAARKP